jgi:hypothetical protein
MKYYIHKNNQQLGPFEESDIEVRIRNNTFSLDDLACRFGEQNWRPLSNFFPLLTQDPHSWMGDSGNLPTGGGSYANPQPPPRQAQTTYEPPPQQQAPWELQAAPVQHVVHHFDEQPETALPMIALVGGIVTASLMVLGLIPCLGWLNWFVLFGGTIVGILCLVAVFTEKNTKGRNKALIGLILVAVALFIGLIRLILGGGCV